MSNTYSYLAYGLGIRATMPLPGLVTVETGEEVNVRFGRVDHQPSEVPEKGWKYFSPAPEEDCLFWQGVASFLVRGGNTIIVDPCPGLDERMLYLLLLGPVLAVLLRQREYLPLHASAVAVDDGAVLFLGSSGWGKSTMAAALHARGHGLVTDDLAAVRVDGNHPVVFPALPQLKLWPEALASLGEDPEKLPRWNPHLEKRARLAAHKFSLSPLPIKKIYVLEEGNALEILPLRSQETFMELVRHTYGSDYSLQTAIGVGSAPHFYRCVSIANSITVCALRRPKCLSQLPYLAWLIEEELARDTEDIAPIAH
jgi:hypothetical protein